MISRWKSEFLENMSAAFEKSSEAEGGSVDTRELYAHIGQLKVEQEFFIQSCWKLGRDLGYPMVPERVSFVLTHRSSNHLP